MENLHKNQIEVLELYIQLEHCKFGKTKKAKYEEIHKRTKAATNTIISWIHRYLDEYKKIREEIKIKKYANICDFKGLTEKQTKYILLRMSGIGQEEAKLKAGYSPKTKAANIEKSPKVAKTILALREQLFDDTTFGVKSILNEYWGVVQIVNSGVEEIDYVDATGPDGHAIEKAVHRTRPLQAKNTALKGISSILGYSVTDELKIQEAAKKDKEDEVILDE